MEKAPFPQPRIRHISQGTRGTHSKPGIRRSRLTICPSNTSHSAGSTIIAMPAFPIGVARVASRPPAEITVRLNFIHVVTAALQVRQPWDLRRGNRQYLVPGSSQE